MSTILSGGKVGLSRGFADMECKDSAEKFMSISTEREILLERKKAGDFIIKNKRRYSKGRVNQAIADVKGCNERFATINKKIDQLANLQSLIVSRVKQSIKPEDWQTIVTLAKQDQSRILENISAW